MRNRLVACCAALFFCAAPVFAQGPDAPRQPPASYAGEWEGFVRIPGEPTRLRVVLSEKGGRWNDTYDLPAHGVYDLPFDTVGVSGDSLFLKLAEGQGELSGRLERQSGRVEGIAQIGENGVPFTFARAGTGQAERLSQEIAEAAPPDPSTHPDSARIVTRDIVRFWAAYDSSTPQTRAEALKSDYLTGGSPGLEDFVFRRVETAEALAEAVNAHARYYESARESTLRVADFEPEIRSAFRRLESLYPEAVYPDVYFMIGRMNSGGTTSPRGLLIGAEMYGRTPKMPAEELSNWHRQVLAPAEKAPHTVVHELIHYQQDYPQQPRTLLGKATEEGVADYVADLVSGAPISTAMYEWGDRHEKELWCEFEKEMMGEDVSGWLYNGSQVKERPADLGYYVGYQIAEAYHEQAEASDRQVVQKLFTMEDFRAFLEKSGYAEKFACDSGK